MSSALVVGYDPQAIPGVDGEALRTALDAELVRFGEHGIDAAMTLVVPDETAESTLVASLTHRPWDVVVVGGGIRKTELTCWVTAEAELIGEPCSAGVSLGGVRCRSITVRAAYATQLVTSVCRGTGSLAAANMCRSKRLSREREKPVRRPRSGHGL
ncbi:hypothetical protein OG422_16480 [Streptomyces sp. NBC_01525]